MGLVLRARRAESNCFNRDPHFQRVMAQQELEALLGLPHRFNRDPHFQRVMESTTVTGRYMRLCFNRDPHFQRVMEVAGQRGMRRPALCFNRDPHFQRVMGLPLVLEDGQTILASIGTLIFRG